MKFNHLFSLLMTLAAFSAFLLPSRFTDGGREHIQGLFSPVARPTRALANAIYGKVSKEEEPNLGGPKTDAELRRENDVLRMQVSSLTLQLEALKELNSDRQRLGDIRSKCTPVAVMGSDPGGRDSLSLSSGSGLAVRQPVLHLRGIAGRISRAGLTGAQVLLVTDRESRIRGTFARYAGDVFMKIEGLPLALAEGKGNGQIIVDKIPMKEIEASGLAVNDWLVLKDSDWPEELDGWRIGRVTSIAPRAAAPLFAEIQIDPDVKLESLREVMVMNK